MSKCVSGVISALKKMTYEEKKAVLDWFEKNPPIKQQITDPKAVMEWIQQVGAIIRNIVALLRERRILNSRSDCGDMSNARDEMAGKEIDEFRNEIQENGKPLGYGIIAIRMNKKHSERPHKWNLGSCKVTHRRWKRREVHRAWVAKYRGNYHSMDEYVTALSTFEKSARGLGIRGEIAFNERGSILVQQNSPMEMFESLDGKLVQVSAEIDDSYLSTAFVVFSLFTPLSQIINRIWLSFIQSMWIIDGSVYKECPHDMIEFILSPTGKRNN